MAACGQCKRQGRVVSTQVGESTLSPGKDFTRGWQWPTIKEGGSRKAITEEDKASNNREYNKNCGVR